MKKLILIFLAFVSINVKAQLGTLANVEILTVTDTVSTGDTLVITWKYHSTGSYFRATLWTLSYNQYAFNYDGASILHAQHDANYIYTEKIKITPAMGTGIGKVMSNMTPNGGNFYIRTSVGINELSKNQDITNIKYFDLLGKEKAPQDGELLIKVSTFSNGYQKAEKVIITP